LTTSLGLDTDAVSIDANLFTLGGDSLKAIIFGGLAVTRSLDVKVVQLFTHSTIQHLAQLLVQNSNRSDISASGKPTTKEGRMILADGRFHGELRLVRHVSRSSGGSLSSNICSRAVDCVDHEDAGCLHAARSLPHQEYCWSWKTL
jgi:aryl carrier-like protein